METQFSAMFNSDFFKFIKNEYRVFPYAKPANSPHLINSFNEEVLKEILRDHNDCWIVKSGKLLPSALSGRVSCEEFALAFSIGGSIVVRHGEKSHPFFREMAEVFRTVFKMPIDIQLYATPAGEEGFGWHFDDEDVFVYQTLGEKEFYLRKNRENKILKQKDLPESFNLNDYSQGPEIRCLLKAGDHLYIPAGWWHKARSIRTSFHISVGVLN